MKQFENAKFERTAVDLGDYGPQYQIPFGGSYRTHFDWKNSWYTRSKRGQRKARNAKVAIDHAELYYTYGQPPYWDLGLSFAVRV